MLGTKDRTTNVYYVNFTVAAQDYRRCVGVTDTVSYIVVNDPDILVFPVSINPIVSQVCPSAVLNGDAKWATTTEDSQFWTYNGPGKYGVNIMPDLF